MSAALGLQASASVVPAAVITGGVVSSVHVTVRDPGVAGFPHASETFHVRVWDRWQPFELTAPSEGVGVTAPQSSVAVADPSAASMSAALGLQASTSVVPAAVITGGVVSSVHVTVRDPGVAGFPHASETFHVRVCDRWQPFELTAPSEGVGVTGPQSSVAVADPSAASMSAPLGLQPSVSVVPLAVISGGVVSTRLTVFVHVLEQPSRVTVRLNVNEPLQTALAFTLTDDPVVEPSIEPSPEIDHA
jgi:hypothetical protein